MISFLDFNIHQLKFFCLLVSENCFLEQDEQDSLRSNSGEEFLTWQDYKAMPFTQCVSDQHHTIFHIRLSSTLV